MAALPAGELIPWVGPLFRELRPVAAFFVYLGLGWSLGGAYSELRGGASGALLSVGLAIHLVLYSIPLIVGYYTFPVKVAAAIEKSEGSRPSYSVAAAAAQVFLEKETGFHGVPAYAIYSMRQSLLANSAQEYIGHEFDGVDDPVGCAVALLNIVLYLVPIGLKWLLVTKFHLMNEPAYISLVFWYLVAMGFSYYGFRKETE
jgi:hypothetical protein